MLITIRIVHQKTTVVASKQDVVAKLRRCKGTIKKRLKTIGYDTSIVRIERKHRRLIVETVLSAYFPKYI